jgi:hypothetical protein
MLRFRRARSAATAIALLILGGACTSNGAAPGSPVGGPCSGDGDCQPGLFCETMDPGGQCLKGCTGDADCGDGNLCALDDGKLKCYRACKGDADCPRAGYPCIGKDGRDPTRTFCDTSAARD